MKWFCLIVLAVGLVGCSEDASSVVADSPTPIVDAGNDAVAEDCGPTTDTVLPAFGLGDVHILCTSCDDGKCGAFGVACASYGEACSFDGGAGVCVACCNGATGELRCGNGGS
jgi:hypothetical protein